MHLDVGRRTNIASWTYVAGQMQPAWVIRSIGSMSVELKYVGRTVGFWEVSVLFFWAHAVRARSSDGHQNVLSLIGYSHMLENR